MIEEIRISKKLCRYIEEDRFRPPMWEIFMPETSQYSGYKFTSSDYYTQEQTTYVQLRRSRKPDFVFILGKVDREPGKRYKRPKLTFDELYAEFEVHSKQFYKGSLPQALAYVKDYANDSSRMAGRILGYHFSVGAYDKTWFYESDTERRRLNSAGVRILKYLEPAEAEELRAKLKRYSYLSSVIRDFKDCRIRVDDYQRKKIRETLSEAGCAAILLKLAEIDKILSSEREGAWTEREELEKYFNAFLEGEGDTQ